MTPETLTAEKDAMHEIDDGVGGFRRKLYADRIRRLFPTFHGDELREITDHYCRLRETGLDDAAATDEVTVAILAKATCQ